MWKLRYYGKSYIYDRLHRAFVVTFCALAGLTAVRFVVDYGILSWEKRSGALVADEKNSSESETTGANVKNKEESKP